MSSKKQQAEEGPWYQNGLRFTCSQCGDCCTGAPGYVWVNKAEIQALAEAVTEGDVEQFEATHVRKVGIRKSLREHADGACVLFDQQSRKCTVYQQRPRQCRTWPFWESNVKSPEAWEETCAVCPGSGQGKLHQLADIEEARTLFRV